MLFLGNYTGSPGVLQEAGNQPSELFHIDGSDKQDDTAQGH